MKWSLLLVACFALAGCASTPDVSTDHDPATDFSAYHTYYWAQPPSAGSPLAAQRIAEGIDARLAAKGWTRGEGSGDVAVVANVATAEKHDLDTFYTGGGMGAWGWGGMGMATTQVTTYTVGTLVVDMFDVKTKKAVWRGTASGTVPESQDKLEAAVNAGLDKMFAAFPPGATPAGTAK